MIDVDYRSLVSRADIHYLSPAEWSVEGIPIGNGQMGTMVWTAPNAVRFQINRSDVFAADRNHAGHQSCSTDYRGACAWLEIDLGGDPLAESKAFRQHLSVYDAECSVDGDGVRLRAFISAVSDVLVIEVDDRRPSPRDLRITLSMWRDPVVETTLTNWPERDIETGTHTARYGFAPVEDQLLLIQKFQETPTLHDHEYHCASSVAVGTPGNPSTLEDAGERARTIVVAARRGTTTVLVSSAASFSSQADTGGVALDLLEKASTCTYEQLRAPHVDWWNRFWSGTFVHASSSDGVADFFERMRTLHMYYSAAVSRGDVPPRCAGLLFQTRGDVMHPSSQYWVWGTQMGYFPLLAADAIELTDPYFRMYVGMLPACRKAAEQRWGVPAGAFIPETTPFNGPVVLPDDAADAYQDVLLGRKHAKELSRRDSALCQYDSHLFYTTMFAPHETVDKRPFTAIGHCVSSGSEVAILAWWRYRYSGDLAFLRDSAYPLLRETVEFYRHLVRRGRDGLYHTHRTNAHEDAFPVDDSIMDLAAIRGTAPLAIGAAEILSVDADLRALWQDLVDHLAPYPMGCDPKSKGVPEGVLADDAWSLGHLGEHPAVEARHKEDIHLTPIFPFEDWTLETHEPEVDKIAQRVIDLAPTFRRIVGGDTWSATTTYTPIACARAGRAEQLPAILVAYCNALTPLLPNGLNLFEGGVQSMGIEHSGQMATTMQEGLLQSVSPRPGQPEIIIVAPAWPGDWNATFRLLARGGFLVTAAVRDGDVAFVEIESRLGETCRLRNPWQMPCAVREKGGPTQQMDDDILCFDTRKGKRYLVLPDGSPMPEATHVSPEPATGPVSFSFTLPSGVTVRHQLGRAAQESSKGLRQREDDKATYEYEKWW